MWPRSLESKSQASVVQIPWFQQTSSDATEFDTSPHSFPRPTRTHPKELCPDAGAFNMSRLWRDPHGLCSSSERTRPAVRVLLDMPLEVNNKCWHRAEMLNPSNGNPGFFKPWLSIGRVTPQNNHNLLIYIYILYIYIILVTPPAIFTGGLLILGQIYVSDLEIQNSPKMVPKIAIHSWVVYRIIWRDD